MIHLARHNRPIARQLMLSVVMFSTMITIITSAYQLYGNYKRDLGAIHYRLQEIQEVHLSSLTTRLWTVDKTALVTQMQNILHLPDMIYLEVKEKGKIIAQVGTPSDKDSISQTYPMIYTHRDKDITIGSLTAQATLHNAYRHFYDQVFDIVISNGIKTFFVTGFILYLFFQLVTRHLDHLAAFAEKLNIHTINENLQLKRPVKPGAEPDELDSVVNAFNGMQKNLTKSIDELRHSEATVRMLLDSTAEAIYGVDSDGNCTFINRSCLAILGYSHATEILGKNIHSLIHAKYPDGKHYPLDECKINKALNGDTHIHEDNEVFWRKDGSHFPVEYWSHPIIEDDKCVGAVVTFFDITERKNNQRELNDYRNRLEQLVSERTHELEIANAELESFSYSVSHDLRTPLRAIDGFSQVLTADYKDILDEDGKNYLIRIRQGAQHMGQLIDDLLSLSRVSKHKLTLTNIDFTELTQSIIDSLKETGNERKLDIHIEKDMTLDCDEYLVVILMSNLLGNAWKYTSKNAVTTIEIGETTSEEGKVIYIKDNGAGFDMQYADMLFKPFQRLHSAEEFPGNGIGLATVQRIIKRHGGRIWAESTIDQGSAFYFTLGNYAN